MSMYSNFNRRLPSWKNGGGDEEEDSFFSTKSWDEFKRRSKKMTEETNEMWHNLDDTRRLTSSSMSMMSSSTEKKRSPKEYGKINSGLLGKTTASGIGEGIRRKDEEPSWRRSQSLNRNESGLGSYKRKIRFGDEEEKNEPLRNGKESTKLKDSNGSSFEMGQIRDDDECFEVTIDVSTYKANELKISVSSNRILIIEGQHEDERVSRTFNRKFSLPCNCLVDNIVPTLQSSKNKLVIWIPKSNDNMDMESKVIPLIVKD